MMDSWIIRVLVIPSAVFLSIIFGASYGSGREVVEFVSSNGPQGGMLALVVLVIAYSVLLCLSFEIARMFKAFNYMDFCKVLLGKGWVLYEIVILFGMVIALSITVTVGGTVLQSHFGTAVWIGTLLIFIMVVGLNYFGRSLVEKSMMVSIAALFIVLAALVVQLLNGHVATIRETFASNELSTGGFYTAVKYAVGGGGYLPLMLFGAIGLRSRSEAFTAGIFAALVTTAPALIFHLAFMAGYPAILEEALPTYWMFDNVSTPMLLNIYVVIMFVLVAQTGVGLMQGMVQRIDAWQERRNGQPMNRLGHGAVATVLLGASMLLGSMGIVALILRAYTVMFASFIIVFVIPLCTYGVWLVFGKQQAGEGVTGD